MHKTRGVKTGQWDDGIGDTLVSVDEVLGDGGVTQPSLDRDTVEVAIVTNRRGPQIETAALYINSVSVLARLSID